MLDLTYAVRGQSTPRPGLRAKSRYRPSLGWARDAAPSVRRDPSGQLGAAKPDRAAANFNIFAFCAAAVFASVCGAMFPLQAVFT
jgi:hypothetical protein